jgi:two-component system, OmpR family, alkaline phosphatase synthesis response regulator PhoP
MNAARILIIEDEETLAEVLSDNLEAEGYQVIQATDGPSGLREWQSSHPNLIILDVMLPKQDGFSICQQMRSAGDTTPVLFLSAKGQPEDRVQGLSVGGDDYLAKPFHLPEFLLRVRNMLRRQGWGQSGVTDASYSFGGHTVDFRRWVATLADGSEEPLGERELGILRLLVRRADEVVSRDDILDEVWGDDAFPSSRTVDNFVMRLRRLFEPNPGSPIYIHTIWGVGYKFTPQDKETLRDV